VLGYAKKALTIPKANAGNHELIQEPGYLATGKGVHEYQGDR
jgi:hypothetical protein